MDVSFHWITQLTRTSRLFFFCETIFEHIFNLKCHSAWFKDLYKHKNDVINLVTNTLLVFITMCREIVDNRQKYLFNCIIKLHSQLRELSLKITFEFKTLKWSLKDLIL